MADIGTAAASTSAEFDPPAISSRLATRTTAVRLLLQG
ncbi:Uncharacterised protein [Mycolicibacterium vanbaalenii]|uniref:Uncharacterized protein n=1 Tax=Mycolicibacterium vanbaalenii TaxID=110539 RepID=A0A5S9R8P1_MYCVN|nr:Uncharacterised protein [Mycolicibacterium vanbaalenii]